MQIHCLTPADYDRWDQYVAQHPDGSFFHLSGWHQLLTGYFKLPCHFYYAEIDGHIVGILPLCRRRSRLFSHGLISLPFCVEAGLLVNDQATAQALDNQACQLAEQHQVDYLEYRHRQRQLAGRPAEDSLYVSFRKALPTLEDEAWRAIPRKQRAVVRKGINQHLFSQPGDLNGFYRLYATSVRNLGTPVLAKGYFRALQRIFGQNCRILTVYHPDGQPLSSVMSFYFRGQVLPYYGGGSDQARRYHANDFMYWQLMAQSIHEGLQCFDFGRSKVGTGSFRFKKHWGFTPEPYHYEYYLVAADTLPALNPNNPRYRYFIAGWQRLPLWTSRLLGPWLARQLG